MDAVSSWPAYKSSMELKLFYLAKVSALIRGFGNDIVPTEQLYKLVAGSGRLSAAGAGEAVAELQASVLDNSFAAPIPDVYEGGAW